MPATAALLLSGLLLTSIAGAQAPLAVEELRTMARSKVGSMRQDFQKDLKRAERILRTARPQSRSPRHLEIRSGLVPWAQVFGKEIVASLAGSDSKNLHYHLCQVLLESRAPGTADRLADLLGTKDAEFDLLLLSTQGRLGDRAVAPRIRDRLDKDTDPAILSASLSALARLGDADVRPLATRHLKHAKPEVRISALQALVATSADRRQDAATVRDLAINDRESAVRHAALRALGAFPGDPHVLRLLHDTLKKPKEGPVRAALEALQSVASKETSRPYLLEVARSKSSQPLRELAAKILLQLGDSRGALALYKTDIAEARKDPRNRNLQRLVSQKLMGIGAWETALDFLERARDPKASARSQFSIYVEMARCHARLGNFSEARRQMKRAGYKNLSAFADDPDFAAMKKSAEFAPLFEKGS